MNVVFKTENPDKIEFTLVITMRLEQWVELRKLLSSHQGYDVNLIYDAIGSCIMQAQNCFYPNVPPKDDHERD